MKGRIVLLVGTMVLCLGLVGTPASWANSLTFQNVTFDLSLNASDNLVLSITNATTATGDWAGIDNLEAFAINQYGTATGLQSTGWTTNDGGLNSSGCDGSGNFTCFNGQSFALTNSFSFEITKTGGTFSLDNPPSLKVLFSGADVPNGHGSLLSQPVPAVPVPGTLLMFGLGFALFIGWNYYRSGHRLGSVGVAA
jgi:hypothetical protein